MATEFRSRVTFFFSTTLVMSSSSSTRLFLLDYGAGNVRSLANSLTELGFTYEWITGPEDFDKADVRVYCFELSVLHD